MTLKDRVRSTCYSGPGVWVQYVNRASRVLSSHLIQVPAEQQPKGLGAVYCHFLAGTFTVMSDVVPHCKPETGLEDCRTVLSAASLL